MGNCWGRGKGNGEEREGGQYTADQGSEWMGIRATTQRRDFQVSKGRIPRNKGKDFQATKGDCQKEWGMHFRVYIVLIVYIYCANEGLCSGYE
jgi:hypothetical protein